MVFVCILKMRCSAMGTGHAVRWRRLAFHGQKCGFIFEVPRHCNLCVLVLWIKNRIIAVCLPCLVVQRSIDCNSTENVH